MRILFLDQFSELGGGQLCLLDLAPAVAAAGWEAHAALPGEGPLVARLAAAGVRVHPLSLGRYSSGSKTVADAVRFLTDRRVVAAELRTLVERLRPAVVYVNGPRLMPAVARAGVRCPVIFHAHNRLAGPSGALVRAAVRRSGATVIAASRFVWGGSGARVVYSGVVGPGGEAAQALAPEAGPKRRAGRPEASAKTSLGAAGTSACATSGSPNERERYRLGAGRPPAGAGAASVSPNGRQCRIGLIGRFAPQKRQREFVAAAGRLPADWRFVLCGDVQFGDRRSERYREQVLSSAPASVRNLGWRDDVYEVLGGLDLLVVPSAQEGGVPRVILEAFAARVPVLALASGAIPEVVREPENGFLLRSGTPGEIARRLRELLARPEQLAAAAGRARRLWLERFTVERYRREVWEVVEEASSRRNTAAAASPTTAVPPRGTG